MAKKQFKAESKRLLDLMINSIYTHKEIFLRELISNASDAIDKLYFISLTDGNVGLNREDFAINLAVDKDARTLTISDNGCGMTRDELENNLGVIARSGTLTFKQEHALGQDVDIIGQFGVGFYSAFMVASNIKVLTRAYGSDEAWLWESSGEDGYTVAAAEKPAAGTTIVLTIRENTDEESYDRFLSSYAIQGLVKKYSDYIRYPIRMLVETSRPKDGGADADDGTPPEYETDFREETLNSMIPLWKKSKSEISEADYNQFYKDKFHDFEDPLLVIHTSAEGAL